MRVIEVVPYDPGWPALYEAERQQIVDALGEVGKRIHHIGSTSVAGLAAKPVIDMILEVSSLADLDENEFVLVALGYEAMGEFGIERRRYFRKGGDERTHQIHAFEAGDPHVLRHLAFRDYLKAHPSVLSEYQKMKIRVAEACNNDIESYCKGKDTFIKKHERKALDWESNSLQDADTVSPPLISPSFGSGIEIGEQVPETGILCNAPALNPING